MSWVKLDDAFGRNPKVGSVQPLGRLLYVMGLCHCADQLTDGEIVSSDLPLLYLQSGAGAKHVGQLVDAALWVRHVDSYWIPDYLAYNPSREHVLKQRAAGLLRAKQSRTNRARSREAPAVASDYGSVTEPITEVLRSPAFGPAKKARETAVPAASRNVSREVTAYVRATPTPAPSVSSTDYENNAVHDPIVDNWREKLNEARRKKVAATEPRKDIA